MVRRMEYSFRKGAKISGVDPQAAGERIEGLRRTSGGLLEPQRVVDDARPDDSPTHNAFEWDDSKAAEQHRRWQARELIGALVVHVTVVKGDEPQPVRAFPNVVASDEQGYTSHAAAMGDAEQRAYLVEQALREAEAWSARHRQLSELATIHEAIELEAKGRRRRKAA